MNQYIQNAGRIMCLDGRYDIVTKKPLGNCKVDNPFNIHARLQDTDNRLSVSQLELGRLQVPGVLADWLLHWGSRQLRRDALYRAVINSVRDLNFRREHVAITYQWRPELVDQVRSRGTSVLLTDADRERLLLYTARIAALAADPSLRHGVSMDVFMGPLFQLAASRSADASDENRALLAALAIYVNGLNLERLVALPRGNRYRPRRLALTLGGRRDLAQHFSISAALAAAGGSPLADAVGLSKEVRDSTRGSGFSFTDLAADRAGVRFAEVAMGSAAKRLQRRLAKGKGESDYMPVVKGLPEFMGADRFQQTYGSVGSPAYRAVAADIEQRISDLAVHQLR